jgi:hypothetical protein
MGAAACASQFSECRSALVAAICAEFSRRFLERTRDLLFISIYCGNTVYSTSVA